MPVKKTKKLTKEQVARRTAQARNAAEYQGAKAKAPGRKKKLVKRVRAAAKAGKAESEALNKGGIKAKKFSTLLSRSAKDVGRKASKPMKIRKGPVDTETLRSKTRKAGAAAEKKHPDRVNKKKAKRAPRRFKLDDLF